MIDPLQDGDDAAEGALNLLLAARNLYGSSGNRRKLFTRFDEILSASVDWSAMTWTPKASRMARPFRFRRLSLRNWKAFERAEFDLSSPEGRPVALIGGNNGNGKTSILEALATGLFGVRAHIDRFRSARDGSDGASVKRSDYRLAIERAMHRQSFERGDRDMSVVIEIESDEGRFEVERRWYFGDDGGFVEDDEELVLRSGEDRDILRAPTDIAWPEFAFHEIERRVAPASMLPFLLFDGEQIRRLADRELGEQVRFGLESALSVTSVRALVDDLSDYARDRGRDIQADGVEADLIARIEVLVSDLAVARQALDDVEGKLAPLRSRRDEIVRTIGAIGNGTYEELHSQLETRRKAQADLEAARHELYGPGVKLLPFAIIPKALLDRTQEALDTGARSTSLTSGQDERMLRELVQAIRRTEPPLPKQIMADIERRTRDAWKRTMGTTVGSGAPALHGYLAGHDARRVHDLLVASRSTSSSEIGGMLRRIDEITRFIGDIDDEQRRRRGVEESRTRLAGELEGVSGEIAGFEEQRRRLDQVAGKVEARIEPLQADLDRRRSQRRVSGSASRPVEAATDVGRALERAIVEAMPRHYEELASSLSRAYVGLAHKGVVRNVTIASDGGVSLLDAFGRDLRDTDASAGENQIFAMALIAAISGLSGVALPLVIDTPLGRLDTGHRDRVLEYFTSRDAQTVLLSQPEEVAGRYYDHIAPRIGVEYHLVYRSEGGGLGETVVESGYFPKRAA